MVAPEIAPIFVDDEVAWNSFGFVAEGGGLTLLPSEPLRVGIQVEEDTRRVSPSAIIFLDNMGQQNDGIQQPEEMGVNGMLVELWDANGPLEFVLDYRITGPDHIFRDGYYRFVNIPPGDYFIRFYPPDGYSISPPNQGDDALDSDGETFGTDPINGDYYQTGTITIGGADDLTWDQGLWLDMDYGDAPATYPTEAASQSNPAAAARHFIVDGIYLGSGVDEETDGQPSANALGDDTNGDDEDGVTFDQYIGTTVQPSAIMTIGETASIEISATVPTTQTGYLNAWLDFNGDGDWDDAGEQIAANLNPTAGMINFDVPVPATATIGSTYARFRFSTEADLTPTGTAVDGEVEDYQVQLLPAPTKTITATSAIHTSSSDLAIGEIVRYQITAPLPEGTMTNFVITDTLPAGLQFLDDGSATAVPLADTSIVSDTFTISGGPFSDGTDPVFSFGTMTNNDTDPGVEAIVLEFNAILLNDSNNQEGETRDNSATITYDTYSATTDPVSITIVEPILSIDKVVTAAPTDAGDTIVYDVAVSNSNVSAISTAFDVLITDTLDSYLTLVSATLATPGYANQTENINGQAVEFLVDQLQPGDLMTMTITATVNADIPAGYTLPNTSYVTYTSLPDSGTAPNLTGSIPPGASGENDGERNGSGIVLDAYNDYYTNDPAETDLDTPSLSKTINPTTYTIGEEMTFEILVTLPEGVTADLIVTDTLPAGLSIIGQR
jgi:fimbrial isopeptide formation D2 family protein/uncharacterized repeat protein (TIGR01451 family)